MTQRRHIDENAIAEALGDLETRRARGEAPSAFEYRDRLGDSHSAFLEILELEAVLDEVIDPLPEEGFPRDFGPFTLVRELGHGAMGVVYEGVHRQLRRPAAVKVLRRGFDKDSASRERFRRETRACAQVRHPHIVEIYEAGEVDGRPFYAMGFVEGRSLSALIKAGEVPEPRALARSMAGIADALEALHAVGVVHRDVKPSNLMVRVDGHLLLADFGHARVGDGLGLTATGETLGTPLYMSPEQLVDAKGRVDARSDVYALGATLYEALAGRPVFQAEDFATLARKILDERPEPVRKLAPTVPAPLEAIVMKALEKRPEDRYASAAQMRDDLLAFADGRRVDGRPVGPLLHFARYLRRRAVPIAAALLAVLGAGLWWANRPATFRLVSVPAGADVIVGGNPRGKTPLEVSLAPGAYDVTLRLDGFAERTRRIELAAGGTREVEVSLAVVERRDGTDFDARDRALRDIGIEIARLDPPSGTRAGPAGLTVLWPRGDVRLEDLSDLALETSDYAPGSVLEFVRLPSEVLHAEVLEGDAGFVRRGLPEKVRAALQVGDQVRFGLRAPTKKPGDLGRGAATFRVVTSDADAVIEQAEERLGNQPASVLAEARVRLLRQRGLRTAVIRELEDLPTSAKGDPRVIALTLRAYEDLGVADSGRGQAARTLVDGLSKEVYERLYGRLPAR